MNTQNLTIRRFCIDDLTDFIAIIRDKMASPYAAYDEQFPTDEASLNGVLSYFCGTDEFLAVELNSEKRLIGYVSINFVDESTRNIGYCIHSAYQRKGYATEAVNALIEHAKSMKNVKKLVAGTAELNVPSVKLLVRAGFTVVGKSEGSFANDADGKPIMFMCCSFEREL